LHITGMRELPVVQKVSRVDDNHISQRQANVAAASNSTYLI
jgi:hypothetical protein